MGDCNQQEKVPAQALDLLSTAIEAGAMPTLEKLTIGEYMVCEKGGLESLFRGLCNGASPHLHTLTFPPSRLHVREDLIADGDDEEDDDEVDVQDGEQDQERTYVICRHA